MVRSGWYETVRPDAGARSRRTVYLAWFPDEGPCISDGHEGFAPLPAEGQAWEWHGPFRTSQAARVADLSRASSLRHPFEAS